MLTIEQVPNRTLSVILIRRQCTNPLVSKVSRSSTRLRLTVLMLGSTLYDSTKAEYIITVEFFKCPLLLMKDIVLMRSH